MAFGYAAALAPIDLHSLYVAVPVLLPFIIVCKAFLNSAPLKDILMFQTGSPLGVLLLLVCELEVVDDEVLLLVLVDVDSELEVVEEMLLVLSSTLDVLVIILEDGFGCAQPDKIKTKAATIIDVIFFFIAP